MQAPATEATEPVITQRIAAVDHRLGPITIRRMLPAPQRQMVGPFIFFDHGGPFERESIGPNAGVPEHPHAGLSTFSYLMHGAVRHRDSAGNDALIKSGDIALMTAGSGITHIEKPQQDEAPQHMFAQMWLALPDAHEETAPTFEHFRADDLPVVEFDQAHARLCMGSGWGESSPTTTFVDTVFAELTLDPGGRMSIPATWEERAVFLVSGDAAVSGQPVHNYDVTVLRPGTDAVLASATGARLLLIGGERFPTPRHIAGSFVASSPDKIRHWMRAWQTGDFPRIAA